jgi:carbonic anhydrase
MKNSFSMTLFVLILISNYIKLINTNTSKTLTNSNSSNKNSNSSHSTSKSKYTSNYKLGSNVFYKKSSLNNNSHLYKHNKSNTSNLNAKSKAASKTNSNSLKTNLKYSTSSKNTYIKKNDYYKNSELTESQESKDRTNNTITQKYREFKPEIQKINDLLIENKDQNLSNNNIQANQIINSMNRSMKNSNTYKKFKDMMKQDAESDKPKTVEPAALKPTDKKKLLNANDNLNIVLEDWLSIASPQFKEPDLYPSIINSDYTRKKIKLNNKNFRINELYEKKTYNDSNYPPSNLSFYFRYSDKNLYYSNSPETLQILDSISIKEIKDLTQEDHDEKNDYSDCIKLTTESKVWYLCSSDVNTRRSWFCQIKKDLGVSLETCTQLILDNVEATVQETKVTQPIILIPLPSEECNAKWNFLEQGEDWECDCKEGKEQSPIDINSYDAITSPVKPVFFYETAPFIIPNDSLDGYYKKNDKAKLVFDKGYLSIKHPNFGTVATLDGITYRAQEVRFYTPSQHSINNKIYDMEIEVIHYGETKGNIHKNLIFSILYEKYPGVYNKFIDDLDPFNLPNPLNSQRDILKDLHLNKLLVNSEEDGFLQMKNIDFYTYQGSLTTPPCTENTIRVVVSEPVRLGSTVLTLFKEAIKTPDVVDEEGNITLNNQNLTNNRKSQALNGRKVWLYQSPNKDSLIYKPPSIQRPEGHYEKVVKRHTTYYEVSNDQPSGIPGAFVVSEAEAKGN